MAAVADARERPKATRTGHGWSVPVTREVQYPASAADPRHRRFQRWKFLHKVAIWFVPLAPVLCNPRRHGVYPGQPLPRVTVSLKRATSAALLTSRRLTAFFRMNNLQREAFRRHPRTRRSSDGWSPVGTCRDPVVSFDRYLRTHTGPSSARSLKSGESASSKRAAVEACCSLAGLDNRLVGERSEQIQQGSGGHFQADP